MPSLSPSSPLCLSRAHMDGSIEPSMFNWEKNLIPDPKFLLLSALMKVAPRIMREAVCCGWLGKSRKQVGRRISQLITVWWQEDKYHLARQVQNIFVFSSSYLLDWQELSMGKSQPIFCFIPAVTSRTHITTDSLYWKFPILLNEKQVENPSETYTIGVVSDFSFEASFLYWSLFLQCVTWFGEYIMLFSFQKCWIFFFK